METPPQKSPEAVEALRKMGAYLRSLKSFSVRAYQSKDQILDSGQKVQVSQTVDLWVRRPDRMRVDVQSDRRSRQLFYDGKTLTIYGPQSGYYASFPAPPTVKGVVDDAETKFGLQVPLADLFLWGTEEDSSKTLEGALRLGPSTIGGVKTEHYAYRQPDVDFQVWIETGDHPLPRKLVITTTEEPTQPQYTAVLAWNLEPKFEESSFTFVAPKGSRRIISSPSGTPAP
jgi:hypothetical protein